MEKSAIRMIAQMISLNRIEVLLLKQYYGGYSQKFYLRDMSNNSLKEIKIADKYEDDRFIHYYFNEIEIDFCRVYQIVDAYGLSETLQYSKLVYDEDFLNMNYYDGDDLGNSYYMEYTEFKVWAPTALEVKVSITKNDTTCSYNMKRLDKGVFLC